MNGRFSRLFLLVIVGVMLTSTLAFATVKNAAAQNDSGEFFLQVSPSPLSATVKPGQTTSLDIKVRNEGPKPEDLKIVPRAFTFDSHTQKVVLDDTKQPDIAPWIHFSAPTFTVQPGQVYTETVQLAVPKDAGFSYSFALIISRATLLKDTSLGRLLNGSIAIFALINVDRPGAIRQLEITHFAPSSDSYEDLPVTLNATVKNSGNTIAQISGNVFIQRSVDDKTPTDTLDFNKTNGFILPGTSRDFAIGWSNGFQVEKTVTADDGTTKKQTNWDWSHLSDLRIGRYTAKLIGVYDDGHRDVPVQADTSFWVIPWKILLVVLAVLLVLGAGVWSIVHKIIKLGKRIKR
jgi:hypothetical protein